MSAQPKQQRQMTARTQSWEARTDPTRREDRNGVVVGPWSEQVKQSTRLLRSARAVRRTRT
ncbi:hypothetical protein [Nocardioides sp. HB32]